MTFKERNLMILWGILAVFAAIINIIFFLVNGFLYIIGVILSIFTGLFIFIPLWLTYPIAWYISEHKYYDSYVELGKTPFRIYKKFFLVHPNEDTFKKGVTARTDTLNDYLQKIGEKIMNFLFKSN